MFTMYTKDDCIYCDKAEKLLQTNFEEYEIIDYRSDPESLELFKRNRWSTVPQIIKGNLHIGGYEELKLYFQKGYYKSKLGVE